MKINTSRSHKKFNTQHIKDFQKVPRVFPFILRVKHKTLHVKLGLGWVGKFCRKINLHEVRLIKSNFRSIEPCRFRPINLAITRFQLLQINTLWASLNLDSMFWSWFANIIHNEVLIHLVPKVLEPNRCDSMGA